MLHTIRAYRSPAFLLAFVLLLSGFWPLVASACSIATQHLACCETKEHVEERHDMPHGDEAMHHSSEEMHHGESFSNEDTKAEGGCSTCFESVPNNFSLKLLPRNHTAAPPSSSLSSSIGIRLLPQNRVSARLPLSDQLQEETLLILYSTFRC